MRQQRTGSLVIAMMFMMVLARVFSGGQAQADDPDFTYVTDILDGWRQLLRTDDLFLIQNDVIYPPGVWGLGCSRASCALLQQLQTLHINT